MKNNKLSRISKKDRKNIFDKFETLGKREYHWGYIKQKETVKRA